MTENKKYSKKSSEERTMSQGQIKRNEDGTLARNSIKYWKHIIEDYELTKRKSHPRFRFVEDMYRFYGIHRQNFIKYYHRYQEQQNDIALLPCKRGPKYILRRVVSEEVEKEIVRLRQQKGLNRYEIKQELEKLNLAKVPSSSTIHNIFKKHNINRLDKEMKGNSKKEKQRIIKEHAGELGHIDCHYLPRNIIENDNKRYYLIALMDDASRIVFVKVIPDIQALTVMFATLELTTILRNKYGIEFKEILSDNGSEFGGGAAINNKYTHPFERLLKELEIKHRYTKPYHPQTNGKIERFWKTLNEDLIDEMVFDSLDHLEEEVMRYSLYYNELRPHSGINNLTPKQWLDRLIK